MTDRRRYYLTTAIAYPNNRPGLHTLYEVIGADVIARWRWSHESGRRSQSELATATHLPGSINRVCSPAYSPLLKRWRACFTSAVSD
mgnify:CR=1 FL=1